MLGSTSAPQVSEPDKLKDTPATHHTSRSMLHRPRLLGERFLSMQKSALENAPPINQGDGLPLAHPTLLTDDKPPLGIPQSTGIEQEAFHESVTPQVFDDIAEEDQELHALNNIGGSPNPRSDHELIVAQDFTPPQPVSIYSSQPDRVDRVTEKEQAICISPAEHSSENNQQQAHASDLPPFPRVFDATDTNGAALESEFTRLQTSIPTQSESSSVKVNESDNRAPVTLSSDTHSSVDLASQVVAPVAALDVAQEELTVEGNPALLPLSTNDVCHAAEASSETEGKSSTHEIRATPVEATAPAIAAGNSISYLPEEENMVRVSLENTAASASLVEERLIATSGTRGSTTTDPSPAEEPDIEIHNILISTEPSVLPFTLDRHDQTGAPASSGERIIQNFVEIGSASPALLVSDVVAEEPTVTMLREPGAADVPSNKQDIISDTSLADERDSLSEEIHLRVEGAQAAPESKINVANETGPPSKDAPAMLDPQLTSSDSDADPSCEPDALEEARGGPSAEDDLAELDSTPLLDPTVVAPVESLSLAQEPHTPSVPAANMVPDGETTDPDDLCSLFKQPHLELEHSASGESFVSQTPSSDSIKTLEGGETREDRVDPCSTEDVDQIFAMPQTETGLTNNDSASPTCDKANTPTCTSPSVESTTIFARCSDLPADALLADMVPSTSSEDLGGVDCPTADSVTRLDNQARDRDTPIGANAFISPEQLLIVSCGSSDIKSPVILDPGTAVMSEDSIPTALSSIPDSPSIIGCVQDARISSRISPVSEDPVEKSALSGISAEDEATAFYGIELAALDASELTAMDTAVIESPSLLLVSKSSQDLDTGLSVAGHIETPSLSAESKNDDVKELEAVGPPVCPAHHSAEPYFAHLPGYVNDIVHPSLADESTGGTQLHTSGVAELTPTDHTRATEVGCTSSDESYPGEDVDNGEPEADSPSGLTSISDLCPISLLYTAPGSIPDIPMSMQSYGPPQSNEGTRELDTDEPLSPQLPPSSLPCSQVSEISLEHPTTAHGTGSQDIEEDFPQLRETEVECNAEHNLPISSPPPSSQIRPSSPDRIFSSPPPGEVSSLPSSPQISALDDTKEIEMHLDEVSLSSPRQEVENDYVTLGKRPISEVEDKPDADLEIRSAKRLYIRRSPTPPPQPMRPTAASLKKQFKKLARPFRSPLVKLEDVLAGKEGIYASAHVRPSPLRQSAPTAVKDKNLQSNTFGRGADAPVTQNERSDSSKHYTAKAAKQFKSPYSTSTDTSSIPSTHAIRKPAFSSGKYAPTIQTLQAKVQKLKQAIKIKDEGADGREDQLEELVTKWRTVGREVAWLVWDTVKDLDPGEGLNADPGMGRWDNTMKSRGGFDGIDKNWGWGDEDKMAVDKLQGGIDDEELASQPHTVGTMLRHLGIDPETLGWDEDEGDFVGDP